ncbi:MAG: hypothetical protein A3F09_01585 [Chlamydiae bacterium RIFCSPHIGHO2_12_FULL_49_11]|nr:MAG: hypothetical protein A3F09_01585 [Chlamydiae bacterium RIFCSPHIGHO2_12_FULL_49_11]
MKPQDLPFFYTFESRRPLFEPPVLCIPPYFSDHDKYSSLCLESFERLEIEFCSGNGDWIVHRALSHPGIQFVAVEKLFKRVRKIWSKTVNHNVSNLLIVCGDAKDFMRHYVLDGSVDRYYMNFPDPWPKQRHAKHRLLTPEFIAGCRVKARGEALFTLVTDSHEVKEGSRALFENPALTQLDLASYGRSYFGDLWVSHGRTLYQVEARV